MELRTCINKNKPHTEIALATEENASVHYRQHFNGYSRTKLCVLESIGDIPCGEELLLPWNCTVCIGSA